VVTTAVALGSGILLVGIAISPARFERVLRAVTPSPTTSGRRPAATWASEHPLVRTFRLSTLTVGAVCIVLGVLGSALFAS